MQLSREMGSFKQVDDILNQLDHLKKSKVSITDFEQIIKEIRENTASKLRVIESEQNMRSKYETKIHQIKKEFIEITKKFNLSLQRVDGLEKVVNTQFIQ